jgi:hypothetical protein
MPSLPSTEGLFFLLCALVFSCTPLAYETLPPSFDFCDKDYFITHPIALQNKQFVVFVLVSGFSL